MVRILVASRDDVVADLSDELRAGAQLSGGDNRAALARLVDRVSATEAVARRLPSDLAAGRRAIRVHPRWRRRYAEPFARQVPLADVTAHVAMLTQVFAEGLADLADRTDLHEPWAAGGPRTRAIVDPLSRAVVTGLNGGDARGRSGRRSPHLQSIPRRGSVRIRCGVAATPAAHHRRARSAQPIALRISFSPAERVTRGCRPRAEKWLRWLGQPATEVRSRFRPLSGFSQVASPQNC